MEKFIRKYWSISKIIAVMFVIWNYEMWIEPFNFGKAILWIIAGSVVTFLAINLLDIVVGLIRGICKNIHRHFCDKRLLKGFCE